MWALCMLSCKIVCLCQNIIIVQSQVLNDKSKSSHTFIRKQMQVFQIPDWWPLKWHFVFTVPLRVYRQWFFCMTKTVSVNIQAMWFNKARYLNVSGFECQDSDSLLGVVSSQRLSSEACRINDIILLMLAHFYFQHVSSVLSLFILYYCWVFYSILCLYYFFSWQILSGSLQSWNILIQMWNTVWKVLHKKKFIVFRCHM